MTYITLFTGIATEEKAQRIAEGVAQDFGITTKVENLSSSDYQVLGDLVQIQIASMKGNTLATYHLLKL
jgi:hypothetical protein